MRVKQILSLCLLFVLSSVFLFCLITGDNGTILSSLSSEAIDLTKEDKPTTGTVAGTISGTSGATGAPNIATTTTATIPSTTTTPSTTTSGGTSYTAPNGTTTTTSPTTVVPTTTGSTTTTTVPTTRPTTTTTPNTTTSPVTTTTGTKDPVRIVSVPITTTSPNISIPSDITTIVHPTSTADTIKDTPVAGTTTTATTTAPATVATSAPKTETDTAATITPTDTASATAPTTTSGIASLNPTDTTAVTTPSASAATTTAEVSIEITPEELSLSSQISGPITDDKKLCVTLKQKVKSCTFKVEGPANRNITVFEPQPQTYCANLLIADFPDGSYKLTVEVKQEVKQEEKTIFNTLAVEINRASSQSAAAQKTSELENKCSQAGANSSDECKNYYLDKYSEQITCLGLSSTDCGTVVKETFISAVVETAKEYASIDEHTKDIINKTMTVGKLENIVNQSNGEKVLSLSVPLKEKETEIQIIPSYGNIILDKNKNLIQTAPIIILIDSDGDGVSDDMEKRLGTKPNNKDTDGDGYKDGEELRAGFNPFGEGKKDMGLSPIEKALVQGTAIEHPKTGGQESATLTVVEAKEIYAADGTEDGYILSGKADANTMVTLFVYSDIPIVTTVTADEYGNWEYHFAETLEGGNHEVYVAINDETGKVVKKSSPMSFLVQEAQAIAVTDTIATSPSSEASSNMMNYYLYAAGGLMLVGVIIFLVAIFKSRNKNKKQ